MAPISGDLIAMLRALVPYTQSSKSASGKTPVNDVMLMINQGSSEACSSSVGRNPMWDGTVVDGKRPSGGMVSPFMSGCN